VRLPLVQLLGELQERPYDVVHHLSQGAGSSDPYAELFDRIEGGSGVSYAAMCTASVLKWMRARYAIAIGPWKGSLFTRDAASGRATGTHPMLGWAFEAGLQVHPYTLRAEEVFLTRQADGSLQSVFDEALRLCRLGVHGYFIDQPDLGVAARDAFLAGEGR
jgi:glycerophosphoryl diester phosphodiesterase